MLKYDKPLIILGNGFDLNLGLKTSYKDFMESYECRILRCYDNNYIINRILNNYHLFQWVDVENELKFIAHDLNKYSYDDKDIIFHAYREIVKAIKNYLKRITKEESLQKDLKRESIAAKLLHTICEYGNDWDIYTFNFTDLNLISNVLFNKNCPVCRHVHGSLKNDDIILGFEDKIENIDNYHYMIKSFDPRFKSCQIIETLSKAKEIIIFGHSLGNTDYPYFSRFFEEKSSPCLQRNDSVRISIVTANDKSRLSILNYLRNMNNMETNNLLNNNEITFYCADEYMTQVRIHHLLKRLKVTEYAAEQLNIK